MTFTMTRFLNDRHTHITITIPDMEQTILHKNEKEDVDDEKIEDKDATEPTYGSGSMISTSATLIWSHDDVSLSSTLVEFYEDNHADSLSDTPLPIDMFETYAHNPTVFQPLQDIDLDLTNVFRHHQLVEDDVDDDDNEVQAEMQHNIRLQEMIEYITHIGLAIDSYNLVDETYVLGAEDAEDNYYVVMAELGSTRDAI